MGFGHLVAELIDLRETEAITFAVHSLFKEPRRLNLDIEMVEKGASSIDNGQVLNAVKVLTEVDDSLAQPVNNSSGLVRGALDEGNEQAEGQ